MSNNIVICGSHDEATLQQIREVAKTAEHVVLCADGHKGYVMPIGGVAAYDNKVSPTGAGYDIACGNCAVKTNLRHGDECVIGAYDTDKRRAAARAIFSSLEFGIGTRNKSLDAPTIDKIFSDPRWEAIPEGFREDLRRKAMQQIGTIGSGNHYLDIFEDEEGFLWVGVHCGSRGFGWTIASGFMALSQGQPWDVRTPEKECLLDLGSPLGDAYWNAMCLAGDYAYAGREWAVRHVAALLGGEIVEMVHNHHNFAWKEEHFGRQLVVVRKGSTPAFPSQMSFIGGSMGDDAVIVRGKDTPESVSLMRSTVHGAGRVMSRNEAAGKLDRKTGKRKTAGKISEEMLRAWLAEKKVTLVGGGLDEAPQAYRRLPDVLRAQGDTIEVVHTLRPHVVCMASSSCIDPYKD